MPGSTASSGARNASRGSPAISRSRAACGRWSPSRDQPDKAAFRRGRLLAGPGVGDAAALSLHPAQLVAAHPRTIVLADLADADLGVNEPVPAREQQLYRAGLR